MKPFLMVVDCDAVCWSAFHAIPARLSHDGMGTAVIYGFMSIITAQQRMSGADRLVFAWDSRKSKRRDMFPGYKQKRIAERDKYTPEEKQIHEIRKSQAHRLRREILPALGFSNVFHAVGYEGDDIIASIVNDYRDTHVIKIVGNDNDLYQLLGGTVVMYDHKASTVVDDAWVLDKYNILPNRWADVKSLAGCPTDEVPGIAGVGYATAVQYLLGSMKATSKRYKDIKMGIANGVEDFTRKLVELPFEGCPHFEIKKNTCTVEKFKAVAQEFGLSSFLTGNRIAEFRRDFSGT